MRMSRTRIVVLVAILILCATVSRPFAGVVTIDFTTVVRWIDDSICLCISDDEVAIGDTLYGYYVFNEDIADSDTSSSHGAYQMASPPYEMVLWNHKIAFHSDPVDPDLRINIIDNDGGPYGDMYSVNSYNNEHDPIYAGNLGWIYLALQDRGEMALSSDSLPRLPPPLGEWPDDHGVLIYGGNFMWSFGSELISMSLRTVTSVTPRYEESFLFNIYPNPFNQVTTLEFMMLEASSVRVIIYNVAGKAVSTLELDDVNEGINRVAWDPVTERGARLPTGIYFVALEIGDKTLSRKVLLLR